LQTIFTVFTCGYIQLSVFKSCFLLFFPAKNGIFLEKWKQITMKQALIDLFKQAVVYKYDLPNNEIEKSTFSTENDKCYECLDNEALAKIIYNSIVYYSYNELEIEQTNIQVLLKRALEESIKFNSNASLKTQKSYGFYGEILLYCFLMTFFNTKPIIARGYFYSPTAKSEIKGYDSYHLLEHDDCLELWFGEAKMYISYDDALDSVLSNLKKNLHDEYLNRNFIEISKKDKYLNIKSAKIDAVINRWKSEGVNLISEIKQQNMKLVYPILIITNQNEEYNGTIKKFIEYINNYEQQQIDLSIPFSLFFIFLPLKTVSSVKQGVIQCIQNQSPLI